MYLGKPFTTIWLALCSRKYYQFQIVRKPRMLSWQLCNANKTTKRSNFVYLHLSWHQSTCPLDHRCFCKQQKCQNISRVLENKTIKTYRRQKRDYWCRANGVHVNFKQVSYKALSRKLNYLFKIINKNTRLSPYVKSYL